MTETMAQRHARMLDHAFKEMLRQMPEPREGYVRVTYYCADRIETEEIPLTEVYK